MFNNVYVQYHFIRYVWNDDVVVKINNYYMCWNAKCSLLRNNFDVFLFVFCKLFWLFEGWILFYLESSV